MNDKQAFLMHSVAFLAVLCQLSALSKTVEYFSSVIPSSDGSDATKLSYLAPQTPRGLQRYPVKSGWGDLFMSLGKGYADPSLFQRINYLGVLIICREKRLVTVFLIKIKQFFLKGRDFEISYSFIDNGYRIIF